MEKRADVESSNSLYPWIVAAVVGFCVGYFVNSSEIQRLRSEVSRLRQFSANPGREAFKRLSNQTVVTSSSPRPNLSLASTTEHSPVPPSLEQRKKQLRADSIEKFVEAKALKDKPEYESVFSQLGVPPERVNELRAKLKNIHRLSGEAEEAISDVMHERIAYEKQVKSSMSDEAYSLYRQYEESKPSVREFENFTASVWRNKGVAIDPVYEKTITSLIQETQAYTSRSWIGPFDGPPEPAIGDKAVIAHLEQEIRELGEQANNLSLKATIAGLPDEYGNLLKDYYQQALEKRDKVLSLLKDPSALERRDRQILEEDLGNVKGTRH